MLVSTNSTTSSGQKWEISTILSVRKINLNASFGAKIHYCEGCVRIMTGSIGGALITLAIKGGLILGSVNSIADTAMRTACLGAFALVAGTSERLVPNFIKRMENSASAEEGDGSERTDKDHIANSLSGDS